jgi:hypothetical protein
MTAHITKTWFEDGKLITQGFEEKDIYKRTWVGLTDDDEILAISNTMPYADRFEFARAIEAKLKDKNNANN